MTSLVVRAQAPLQGFLAMCSRHRRSGRSVCSFVSGWSTIVDPISSRNLLFLKRLESDLTFAHIFKSRGERNEYQEKDAWSVEALSFTCLESLLRGLAEACFQPSLQNVTTAGTFFFFASPLYRVRVLDGDPLSETEKTAAHTAYGMLG